MGAKMMSRSWYTHPSVASSFWKSWPCDVRLGVIRVTPTASSATSPASEYLEGGSTHACSGSE